MMRPYTLILRTTTEGNKTMPRAKYHSPRHPRRCPTHPGALLRDIALPEITVSKSAIAEALGISRNQFYLILNEEQRITPETAVRLGAAFGNSPRFWVNMQAAYDLWHAERQIDVSEIPPIVAA